MSSKPRRIFVLDASAFMYGYPSVVVEGEHFTPLAVLEELKSLQARAYADAVLSSKHVEVLPPPRECLEEVSKKAEQLGSLQVLSRADLEVLALALYLKKKESAEVTVVSDDYDVQNVAAALGLRFQPLRTSGIKAVFKWIYYCPSCGKIYRQPQPSLRCEICGSFLKRRPRKRG
ncbi:MAG: hypothetical protein J7L98_04440 [Candidatus Verstraetearchaeota archaeon]|nr:hypothetical protein [Candidatus Verstraetearchaeota archaeon]